MKEENLDFEVVRDFFTETKYSTIQNCLKKNVGILYFMSLDMDLPLLDVDLALNGYCL